MISKNYGTLLLDKSAKPYIDSLKKFHERFLTKEPTDREILDYYMKETVAVFVLETLPIFNRGQPREQLKTTETLIYTITQWLYTTLR